MNEDYEITNHDMRQYNQMSLDVFTLDLDNWFETVVTPLINKLEDQRNDLQSKVDKFHKREAAGEEIPEEEYDFELMTFGTKNDIYYLDQELYSLVEMKIIYLYKFFEINLKRLIRGAYTLESTKAYYKWESIVDFLRGQKIEIKEIDGYRELNQIRMVNNSLKHSGSFEDNIKNGIPEFSNTEFIGYSELDEFYKRVSGFPKKFLTALSSFIYSELYEFNDEKIDSIVKELTLRMEKQDVEKFITRLKFEYGLK